MDSRIGTILHQARSRRKIDLSEVETATRIRARYLRAIEDEEWDVLPGGVYTRGFIRTYASFLGLDGERLAGDYRREVEAVSGDGEPAPTAAPAGAGRVGRRRTIPPAGWVTVAAVALVGVLAIALLPDGGGGGDEVARRSSRHRGAQTGSDREPAASPAHGGAATVRLAASAEVWICMLDAKGRHLIDGQVLEAGEEEGPFRSGSFTVSFGNGEVSMVIDGEQAEIPATSSPIGYSIDSAGRLTELDEAERPTCI